MRKSTTALSLVVIGSATLLPSCSRTMTTENQSNQTNGRGGYTGGYYGGTRSISRARSGSQSGGNYNSTTRGGFGSTGRSFSSPSFSGGS